MQVGFTGTRHGMTAAQSAAVQNLLAAIIWKDRLHHGDCIGADAEAHNLAESAGFHTVSHPGDIPPLRAYKVATETREPKPCLVRNRDIVDETEILIAAPSTDAEVIKSGTWATVRYARKAGRKIYIVNPDGHGKYENTSDLEDF